MTDKLKSLGLCLGASNISLVHMEQELEGNGELLPHITAHSVHTHEGDAKSTLIQALKGIDIQSFDRIAATGCKFRGFVTLNAHPVTGGGGGAWWGGGETPYLCPDGGACFCKADRPHATNKGIPKPQVTAGLCKMMAD